MKKPEALLKRARRQMKDRKYLEAIGTLDDLYATGFSREVYFSMWTSAMLGFIGYRYRLGVWQKPKAAGLTDAQGPHVVLPHERRRLLAEEERQATDKGEAAIPIQLDAETAANEAVKAFDDYCTRVAENRRGGGRVLLYTARGPKRVREIWFRHPADQGPGPFRSWCSSIECAEAKRRIDGSLGSWRPVRRLLGGDPLSEKSAAQLVRAYAASAILGAGSKCR